MTAPTRRRGPPDGDRRRRCHPGRRHRSHGPRPLPATRRTSPTSPRHPLRARGDQSRPHPPPPAAVRPSPPRIARLRRQQGPPAWWPPSPSPIPTWTDASPVYTQTAARMTVARPHLWRSWRVCCPSPSTPGARAPRGVTPAGRPRLPTYDGATPDSPCSSSPTRAAPRTSRLIPRAPQLGTTEHDEAGAAGSFRDCASRFGPTLAEAASRAGPRLHHHGPGLRRPLSGARVPCRASRRAAADLFVGGLPDYIRVDVEMREPRTCTAMYYARAYEQHAIAMQQVYAQRGSARPALRPAPMPRAAPPRAAGLSRPGGRRRGAARRRRRACFMRQRAPDHMCARLFYRRPSTTPRGGPAELAPPRLRPCHDLRAGRRVRLRRLSSCYGGHQNGKDDAAPVTINGERLTALVDTGSTHNFLSNTAMHRLALQPVGSEKYSVTFANGDRLMCQAWRDRFPCS
ncbi:hypothetical protein QYE76_046509 [Lolium multiflorum]|uniref:Uncharacterized protein n=1 Tax=Lolium multiflorum TaxID=4521 RepID=A0AAD8TQ35_LOLMU|nr:hypothetical protein QYE76_046509 [Lolium multiflorum]